MLHVIAWPFGGRNYTVSGITYGDWTRWVDLHLAARCRMIWSDGSYAYNDICRRICTLWRCQNKWLLFSISMSRRPIRDGCYELSRLLRVVAFVCIFSQQLKPSVRLAPESLKLINSDEQRLSNLSRFITVSQHCKRVEFRPGYTW